MSTESSATSPFTVVFVKNSDEFNDIGVTTIKQIEHDSVFWIAYPKGTSKIKTDVNRDKLWKMVEPYGMKPVAMVAVDKDWSAMRCRPADKVKTK